MVLAQVVPEVLRKTIGAIMPPILIRVKSTIYKEAFWELKAECNSNKKTSHITYKRFGTSDYLLKLSLELARFVFKAKTRMFDIKSNYNRKYRSVLTCPFRMVQDETFDHLFACPHGKVVPNILQGVAFNSFFSTDCYFIESLGKFLQRDSLRFFEI